MSRGWLVTLAVLLALGAGGYTLYRYLEPTPLPPGILYGNGHVEGTEVRVAAEVGGRVIDSALVEGEPVAAGWTPSPSATSRRASSASTSAPSSPRARCICPRSACAWYSG